MSPTHGDYDPSKGWYSAHTKAWHNDPKKIGTYTPPLSAEDVQHLRGEYDRMTKRTFKAQPQLDRLIKLRDSDRPDDRAKFEQIAKGGTRMTLHDYEAAKGAAETDGAA